MTILQENLAALFSYPGYRSWKKENPDTYLTHFFSQLDSSFNQKSGWEIGFYDPQSNKITVFVQEGENFIIKPADDIFQEKPALVEKLNFEKVNIDFEKASEIFQANWVGYFPKESIVDGFVILQMAEKKSLWNFTFITRTIKFVNLKIDAEDGKINSHLAIDLVDKGDVIKESKEKENQKI